MSLSHPAPLRVLFLGPLRDRLGCESTEIPFPPEGAQALSGFVRAPAELARRLAEKHAKAG